MLKFGKIFAGFGNPDTTPKPLDRSDYDGEGIWRECHSCGVVHEIEQPAQFRALLEQQCTDIGDSSAALYKAFRIGEPDGRWDADPDTSLFKFTHADGSQCFARYSIIGSYNPDTHSWLWGWSFPEHWFPHQVLAASDKAYDFGEAEGWQVLTEPNLLLNDHEAWHLTKLAAHLMGYPMVYRAKVNDLNYHYFAIDRPVWSQ